MTDVDPDGSDGPERHEVFRAGRVHVLDAKCSTCIFRPGNLMRLAPGRVRGMVTDAVAAQSVIPCHATIRRDDVDPAICRGYFDAHGDRVDAIQIAGRLGLIEFDPAPEH